MIVRRLRQHQRPSDGQAPYAGRYQNQLAGPQPAVLAQPGHSF